MVGSALFDQKKHDVVTALYGTGRQVKHQVTSFTQPTHQATAGPQVWHEMNGNHASFRHAPCSLHIKSYKRAGRGMVLHHIYGHCVTQLPAQHYDTLRIMHYILYTIYYILHTIV